MKRHAFPGSGPEVDARYQRAGHWLRAAIFGNVKSIEWLSQKGFALRKAQGEGINSAGGFLVPVELSNAILDLREVYGVFRRMTRIVPMASDEETVPRRPGGTGAFFFGENSAATSSSVLVDKVGLTAKKIGSLILLSNELEEDAMHDAVDFIANEIAWAFGSKEDDCAFNGDGTSTYGGMYGVSQIPLDGNHGTAKIAAAATHNTFLKLDSTDLGSCMAGVRASAMPRAAWYISQSGFAQTLCRLAGTGGGYLYTGELNGVPTPFYLGFPVIFSQKLPGGTSTQTSKVMLAFGSMYDAGVLGQRRQITIARSPDRYMDQDQIGILGTERFDAVLHDMGDNTNAGSLAALVGTS